MSQKEEVYCLLCSSSLHLFIKSHSFFKLPKVSRGDFSLSTCDKAETVHRPKWGLFQRQIRNPGVSTTRNKGLNQAEGPRARPTSSWLSLEVVSGRESPKDC